MSLIRAFKRFSNSILLDFCLKQKYINIFAFEQVISSALYQLNVSHGEEINDRMSHFCKKALCHENFVWWDLTWPSMFSFVQLCNLPRREGRARHCIAKKILRERARKSPQQGTFSQKNCRITTTIILL